MDPGLDPDFGNLTNPDGIPATTCHQPPEAKTSPTPILRPSHIGSDSSMSMVADPAIMHSVCTTLPALKGRLLSGGCYRTGPGLEP